MHELALFAGAGGGILGGKLLGWRTVCAVELDAYSAPLRPSVLRTSESASGFWPTPIAQDDNKTPEAHMAMKMRMPGGPRTTITSLQVAAKAFAWPTPVADDANNVTRDSGQYQSLVRAANTFAWPTPRSEDSQSTGAHRGTPELHSATKAWGTPTARDHKDSGDCSNVPENGLLGRMVKSFAGTTDQRGSLNPEFHLWLMGWPAEWNALEPLATDKYRSWLRQHGEFSQSVPSGTPLTRFAERNG